MFLKTSSPPALQLRHFSSPLATKGRRWVFGGAIWHDEAYDVTVFGQVLCLLLPTLMYPIRSLQLLHWIVGCFWCQVESASVKERSLIIRIIVFIRAATNNNFDKWLMRWFTWTDKKISCIHTMFCIYMQCLFNVVLQNAHEAWRLTSSQDKLICKM